VITCQEMEEQTQGVPLGDAVRLSPSKVLTPGALAAGDIRADIPVLVLLAAGKGTRFGASPKCVQPVCGLPLARHSIQAFRAFATGPVLCLVHHREDDVISLLGDDVVYIHSDNPTGGTAFAAMESFCVEGLETANPLLVITMGDRVVPTSMFEQLHKTHGAGSREADLTLLSMQYEPPRHRGKGRIARDAQNRVVRIVEQREIDAMPAGDERAGLDATTEANCSLYAVRALTLHRYLKAIDNDNAQQQYYFTDIVAAIHSDGGEVRSVTTAAGDPDYDLLCCDVTRPGDLALLEGVLSSGTGRRTVDGVSEAASAIRADRPAGQAASIAVQLQELIDVADREELGLHGDRPVGIGVSGGRLRIAFMHPDMGRFFGPAWQMPVGAANAEGREQIVVIVQSADDGKLHLYPTDPQFRERLNSVSADPEYMFPGEDIADWYSFEGFGTRMAENLLLSLGYFSDAELDERTQRGDPLPPPSLWLRNSMRRPFSLIGNALASLRTLREGALGERVQTYLGRDGFTGLRVMSTGNLPRGGFSSSSAVTLAMKNAVDALFSLKIAPDLLVNLACQAEYGTGVRAGSLDQATEQMGRAGQGTLISSNPREDYRVIGVYPVPSDRFRVIFPYTIDRDREAWKWSAGAYAGSPNEPEPTTSELRKLTGKAAELVAILTRLPVDADFFPAIEAELVKSGELGHDTRRTICDLLLQVPLRITRETLRERLSEHRQWYADQLAAERKLDSAIASEQTDGAFEALLTGWSEPLLRRGTAPGVIEEEIGVPLRAMMAYLYGEVAKNFYLIHHSDQWIEYVTRSQCGDRSLDIDPASLPSADAMMKAADWESGLSGPDLMNAWLDRYAAQPVDFNRGLDDASLSAASPPSLHLLEGGNFFRGIALIDLAEAMLKRAFGVGNVAVRVNAAGQGDFFQVHVDTAHVEVEAVKTFLRSAFYDRFGLAPKPDFVELHPGGGAVGLRLSRFDQLRDLVRALQGPYTPPA